MRFEVLRGGIKVIPECPQDIAYIEDTLRLRADGDFVSLKRRNSHGLSSVAYLETFFPVRLSMDPRPDPGQS